MLNNVGELLTEVLVRNNRTTTDGFITDAMLMDWVRMSHKWATAFHKWPFTEARDQSTAWSGSEETAYTALVRAFGLTRLECSVLVASG